MKGIKLSVKKFCFKKIHGVKMALRLDDPGISTALRKPLFFKKWHREPEFMDLLEDNLLPTDRFLDIGCNIGYVSLYVLRRLSGAGKLLAIEPDPLNIETFRESLNSNPGLDARLECLEEIAFADTSGTVRFNFSQKSNLHRIVDGTKTSDANVHTEVPVTTFDNYFKDKAYPTFIKMDVEGAELSIFRGMEAFLESNEPCKILMELHPSYYDQKDCKQSFGKLFSSGFAIDTFVSATESEPKVITDSGYKPYASYKSGEWSRGLYSGVSIDHFFEFVFNKEFYPAKWKLRDLLRHPLSIFRPRRKYNKVARAVLLVRH